MAKTKTQYVCRECGALSPKWQGQCPSCNAWNTLEEAVVNAPSSALKARSTVTAASRVVRLSEVTLEDTARWPTGSTELDRTLGGGLVPGGVILIGGDPGIGKSTLTLQVVDAIAQTRRALYVTGEESAAQVASRARRLALDLERIEVLPETGLEAIFSHIGSARPDVVVIDSIQTLYSEAFNSAPGSVVQVRECAAELVRYAKSNGVAIIIVGHVTKEGSIAGPRVLEHLVDTVIYFEGEAGSNIRIIRALKNRFGAANEIGVFSMTEDGLRGVSNPSSLFLARGQQQAPGNVVFPAIEGSRPLLVQVQALVDRTAGNPRRVCTGFDAQRLAMLLAVMNRHLGSQLGGFDVFINVVGGIKINEPAADLPIIAAIWSSLTGKIVDASICVFGEVGLGGEVRPVVGSALRIAESQKLGFGRIVGSAVGKRALNTEMRVDSVERVDAAIEVLREV
ncbi:MAG: DNA repair protein RadA [Betaproteobacteria bacterium]|nr:MAG: DNA repair protein RadA [Betaproteobacteria bacterium]